MVCVYTRKVTDELTSLVSQLEKTVAQNQYEKTDELGFKYTTGLRSYVVLMTDNPADGRRQLEQLQRKLGLKSVDLAVYDGADGPEKYRFAAEAEITVMHWIKTTVTANQAFRPGALDRAALERIVEDAEVIVKEDRK